MIEVHGIDMSKEAYRISTDIDGEEVDGLVPEGLVMSMLGLARRPGHQEVYHWLANHRKAVHSALAARLAGREVRAPFNLISLDTAE